jgi:alpha-beta hydrolase superfamily lysophospholipase
VLTHSRRRPGFLGRRVRVALGIPLVVAAAATVFYYPGPSISDRVAPGCTKVLVVGLRGNGDTVDAGMGMGEDSWAVARRLASRLAGRLDATMIGFPYSTGPWWRLGGHVRAAVTALRAFLADRRRSCPTESLALIGQSEGAAVVHLTLPSLGSELAVAVLLADPLRVAESQYDDLMSRDNGLLSQLLLGGWGGVGPVQDVVPASMMARARSYCLHDDPVCDANPMTVLQRTRTDVHTSYRNNPGQIADRAAAFAASQLLR